MHLQALGGLRRVESVGGTPEARQHLAGRAGVGGPDLTWVKPLHAAQVNFICMERWQLNQLRLALAWRRQTLIEDLRRDVARARGEPFGELAGTAPDIGEVSVATLLADVSQAELAAARCVECQRRHEKTYRA